MTRHRNRARIVHGAALTGAALLTLVPSLAPAATAVPASTGTLATTATSATALPTGLSRLLAGGTPTGRAIATFDTVPTAADVDALESLGLTVQPMEHLKLALVAGPVEAMRAAVTRDVATDVYPDEKIELLDTASTDAMGTANLRAKGLTGKGVNVAVVDSGCDATHPDLAGRVRHNVALYSAEYANYPSDSFHTLVVPMDQGPASNTDLGSGHGTHVAGIIAADSSSVEDGSRFGVAPDATLECFAIGAVIFTTAVVTAYDYMLDQPNLWDIDVVNNSWGNSFRQFDPREPVHQATKAVADQGVTVVFAAGNSGSEEVQASQNPWSLAPWVISVAAGTVDHHRGGFSSNGLAFDNSRATAIGAGGRTTYWDDRIGVVHPDITAPGVDISSSCDSTGTVIGPCAPGDNATASGTSMASPHVAGAAAVLKQAQSALTPKQVRLAMQATATPVLADGKNAPAPFWQVGYGYVELDAAVALVRGKGWRDDLADAAARADRRVKRAGGFDVVRSDFWTYDAPRATAGGSDSRTVRVKVGKGVDRLAVALAHPSLGTVGANLTSYIVTVTNEKGKVVGTTTESLTAGSGTATAVIRLAKVASGPGVYSFAISGEYAASDPDTLDSDSVLGRMVTLHVAQLARS
ncbi:MAG: S8 family peptidase [Nocardioides sp.]